MMWYLLAVGNVTAAAGIGYWLGVRHTLERVEDEVDRMRRIEPPNRTAGLPTNLDAPPSIVSQPHMRRATWRR